MAQLMCSAAGCVNNLGGLCSANFIHIGGKKAHKSSATECETFAEKGIINALSNFTNMNVTGEIKQLFNRNSIEMSPSIKCDAENCIHNSSRICTARNVQIYGPGAESSEGTECETFKEIGN